MSLEQALAENTAALLKNSTLLERVIAGQAAAIEKIEGAKAGTTTRARAAKEEPAKTETPAAAAETPKAEEPTKPAAAEVSDDDLKDTLVAWRGKDEKTATEFMGAMVKHFGVAKILGTLDADQRKQALFFAKRKIAGLAVDFGADYDFDGDPAQGGAVEEDPLG